LEKIFLAGRFTPGSFTNQIQAAFKEPRLIVLTNPIVDHQAVTESAFVNIPVIAFADPATSLRYIDIAIPCNNRVRTIVKQQNKFKFLLFFENIRRPNQSVLCGGF